MNKTQKLRLHWQGINRSEYQYAVYNRMIKDYRDYICEMEAAEDRGIEKGKTEAARNMIGIGLSFEIISSATGLSQQTIAGLK